MWAMRSAVHESWSAACSRKVGRVWYCGELDGAVIVVEEAW